MIGRIQGELIEKNPPHILVDVHGIGFNIDVPMSSFYNLPDLHQTVTLLTEMIVREDAELLYGFLTSAERDIFRQLLKISGVGPRTALAILSGLSVELLTQAVANEDSAMLTRVPGIGKKTAERLILELKGKLNDISTGTVNTLSSCKSDIVSALVSLGYSQKEALASTKALPNDISVNDGIREALKTLSKQ